MKGKGRSMARVLWDAFGTDQVFTDAQAREVINAARLPYDQQDQITVNKALAKMRYAGQIVEVGKSAHYLSCKAKVGLVMVKRTHKCTRLAEFSEHGTLSHEMVRPEPTEDEVLYTVTHKREIHTAMGTWAGLLQVKG